MVWVALAGAVTNLLLALGFSIRSSNFNGRLSPLGMALFKSYASAFDPDASLSE